MHLLEDARALLATGPLCDHCLGRPFADLSFGLSNAERGHALRVTAAMDADEDFEAGAGADCWVCEGHCAAHDAWAERVADDLADHEFATYQVGTRVPPLIEENDRLLREDAGLDPEAGEAFKAAFNREVGKRVGQLTGAEVDFERPDVLALLNVERGDVDVQVNPAFVYGRYRKLERDVPQTEWPCRECGGSGRQLGDDGEEPCEYCDGSGYQYPTSVEQEVAPPVREAMAGDEALFHGAGREDVDALMLGTGRPFVVEVKEPRHREPDVAALEAEINDAAEFDVEAVDGEAEPDVEPDPDLESEGDVEVEGLRLATYEMVERVKELDASKRYRATVALSEAVDEADLDAALGELEGATVEQYTPQRVDHRRASTTRTRTVYDVDGEVDAPLEEPLDTDDAAEALEDAAAPDYDAPLDSVAQTGTIEIHGEGGLYVKELISGDEGRTEPSLAGLLGVDVHVTALDVLDVEGEEESFEDEAYFWD